MTYKVLQSIVPVISPVTHLPYCSYYDITGLTTVPKHNKPTLHQHLGFLCQVDNSFVSSHGELYSFFWIFIQKLLSQRAFHYHSKQNFSLLEHPYLLFMFFFLAYLSKGMFSTSQLGDGSRNGSVGKIFAAQNACRTWVPSPILM